MIRHICYIPPSIPISLVAFGICLRSQGGSRNTVRNLQDCIKSIRLCLQFSNDVVKRVVVLSGRSAALKSPVVGRQASPFSQTLRKNSKFSCRWILFKSKATIFFIPVSFYKVKLRFDLPKDRISSLYILIYFSFFEIDSTFPKEAPT